LQEDPRHLVLELPPFSFLPKRLSLWLARRNLALLHFLILATLYGALAAVASFEQTTFIKTGIGILQNPPFFAHLLLGASSVPLVLILASRVLRIPKDDEETSVIGAFLSRVRESRSKVALFGIAFLIGLFALAYTLVLSAYYRTAKINIYDSISHPLTFTAYLVVRAYLYLFCYPMVFASAPTITYSLFGELKRAAIPYRPFHYDEMGGLRKYFVAVDRPVYALQSFAVIIALMNYLGWGGMLPVPKILAIAAPVIVTILAIFLFYHFNAVLVSKKQEEIRTIRAQQMELYSSARGLAALKGKECLELLERIEATERLIDSIKRGNSKDLQKYFLNMGILIVTQVAKPFGEMIVQKFFGGGP
jgi:hypothetical protein